MGRSSAVLNRRGGSGVGAGGGSGGCCGAGGGVVTSGAGGASAGGFGAGRTPSGNRVVRELELAVGVALGAAFTNEYPHFLHRSSPA